MNKMHHDAKEAQSDFMSLFKPEYRKKKKKDVFYINEDNSNIRSKSFLPCTSLMDLKESQGTCLLKFLTSLKKHIGLIFFFSFLFFIIPYRVYNYSFIEKAYRLSVIC